MARPWDPIARRADIRGAVGIYDRRRCCMFAAMRTCSISTQVVGTRRSDTVWESNHRGAWRDQRKEAWEIAASGLARGIDSSAHRGACRRRMVLRWECWVAGLTCCIRRRTRNCLRKWKSAGDREGRVPYRDRCRGAISDTQPHSGGNCPGGACNPGGEYLGLSITSRLVIGIWFARSSAFLKNATSWQALRPISSSNKEPSWRRAGKTWWRSCRRRFALNSSGGKQPRRRRARSASSRHFRRRRRSCTSGYA